MNGMDARTRKVVLVSLLMAVVAIVTIVVVVPIPNISGAYINAGDAAVYIAAYMLGGPWGALSAAVGSAMADLVLGSVVYMPATFIIKGLMALIAGALMNEKPARELLAVLVGGLVMPAGYFLYECVLLGRATALAGLPFNLIQYAGGALLGYLGIRAVSAAQSLHRKDR